MLALIQCPDCKTKISETAERCPKCGFVLTRQKVTEIQQAEGFAKGMGCLLAAAIFGGWGLYSLMSPNPPKEARTEPAPLTEKQKAENAAWERKYQQERALLRSNLNKASPDQLRAIFAECRAKVVEVVRKEYKGPFEAVIVDETSPDTYQAAAGLSGGSYYSTEERLASFLKGKKQGSAFPELDLNLNYTAIFIGESFSGARRTPHTYKCALAPDLSVEAPTGVR